MKRETLWCLVLAAAMAAAEYFIGTVSFAWGALMMFWCAMAMDCEMV